MIVDEFVSALKERLTKKPPTLEEIAEQMRDAYRERVAAGFDRATERRKQRAAFSEACRSAGYNRRESRMLARRML